MNREYKFRAWDGEKMHDGIIPWQWDFVISKAWHKCEKSTGDGFLGSGGNSAEMLVPAIRFIEVMQYTGLKDKNGKEIYEGDILNVCNGSINSAPWMDKPYAVEYTLNKGFNICMFCWNKKGESVMDSTHWCEVIGNIHQNPDLLK